MPTKHHNLLRLGYLGILLACVACARRTWIATHAQPAYLAVSGVITFEETGAPLAGVRVRIYLDPVRETRSDSTGRYRIDSLPWQVHTVVADGIGLMREQRVIEPSCTVDIVDDSDRVVQPGRCSPPEERLLFSMRRQKSHGR